MIRASILPALLLGISCGIFVGCNDGAPGVGSPCAADEDCGHGMVCDVHDGQGTCQEDHGHEGGHETGGVDCEVETRDDEYALGLSKSGELWTATFVSADPAPPAIDDNTWVLEISDLGGAPVDGLDIVVIPWMPDHGHGTAVEVEVTATGNPGEYSVTPVNMHMAGYWEITLDLSSGDEQDTIMFGFCVE